MNDDERKLMEFCDGELDGAGEAEIAARLRGDAAARAELARLGVVRELVRGVHEQRVGSVDLTDAILRRAVAARPAPRNVPSEPRRRWGRLAAPAGAVLAVAAMVALFVASYRETEAPREAPHLAAVPKEAPRAEATTPVALEEPSAEPHEAGVSIQTVDFGATQGAIFLVSAGESETMVVWTLEDAKDKG